MQRHFTATVYIFQNEKTLLLLHPKHRKWLPPGGHLEANETPPECALREALEETGLPIELIKEEHLWINQSHAVSCERPFMCLVESIPAYANDPAHQHIDFIFLAKPVEEKLPSCQMPLRWFTLQEIRQLESNVDIFPETQEILFMLFSKAITIPP